MGEDWRVWGDDAQEGMAEARLREIEKDRRDYAPQCCIDELVDEVRRLWGEPSRQHVRKLRQAIQDIREQAAGANRETEPRLWECYILAAVAMEPEITDG